MPPPDGFHSGNAFSTLQCKGFSRLNVLQCNRYIIQRMNLNHFHCLSPFEREYSAVPKTKILIITFTKQGQTEKVRP